MLGFDILQCGVDFLQQGECLRHLAVLQLDDAGKCDVEKLLVVLIVHVQQGQSLVVETVAHTFLFCFYD